jgi:hypothetical protein
MLQLFSKAALASFIRQNLCDQIHPSQENSAFLKSQLRTEADQTTSMGLIGDCWLNFLKLCWLWA